MPETRGRAAPGATTDAERIDTARRIGRLRDALLTGLVERDVAVRLALLAALAGEHLLLLGPPGTAKSLVARRLRLAFREASYFERLLTRFTVPEELFGPLSIKGLEEDRYQRLTASYMPQASIAFLDEIFKANSAILNSLLTLLNEREFDNGTERQTTPLVAVVGASNEVPEGDELSALFDRFLLRLHVGPVSGDGFIRLLELRGEAVPEITESEALTAAELEAIRADATAVDVPADVVALLRDLRRWCAAEGVAVSDRRWRKIVGVLQVSALTNGRTSVSVWDCWLLQHCVGDEQEDRERVYDWYARRVGATASTDTSRLARLVLAWETRLQRDRESRTQCRDAEGRPVYLDHNGDHTTETRGSVRKYRDGRPLCLAPEAAYTQSDPYHQDRVRDRTNGGDGYTVEDLGSLFVFERGSRVRVSDWSELDEFLEDDENWLMSQGDLAPLVEPTRHAPTHVADCLSQLTAVRRDVEAYADRVRTQIASLEADIRGHLWVTPDFIEPATTTLVGTRDDVDALLVRIAALHDGYDSLPRARSVSEEIADAAHDASSASSEA